MGRFAVYRTIKRVPHALAIVALVAVVAGCQSLRSKTESGCKGHPAFVDCMTTASIGKAPVAQGDADAPLEEGSADDYADTEDFTVVDGNPRVEAARQSIDFADEEITKARAGNGPTLNAIANSNWQDDDHGSSGDNLNDDDHSLGLRASLPIRDAIFGRPRVQSAKANARAAAHSFRAAEQSAIIELARVVTQIERDTKVLKALDDHVVRLSRLLQQAIDRRQSGDMSQTDIDQIRLKLVSSRIDRAEAQARLLESRATLPTVVGAAGTTKLRDVSSVVPLSRDMAVSEALKDSPDIMAAREEYVAAEADVSAARREFLPQLNLDASAKRRWEDGDRSGDNDLFLGLSVDLPLYDGGLRGAEVRQRRATARERDYNVIDQERTVASRVKADWALREAARQQLALSGHRIAAARAALSGVGRARDIGARTIEDELNAAADLLAAIIGRSDAQQSEVLAEHRLAAQIGRLSAVYTVNN